MKMKAKLINLTPHTVTLVAEERYVEIPPSGQLARVSVASRRVGEVAGIPIITSTYNDVVGLPSASEEVYYIVSAMVRAALPKRLDILSPAEFIRDEKGQIIGCKALEINPDNNYR